MPAAFWGTTGEKREGVTPSSHVPAAGDGLAALPGAAPIATSAPAPV